MISLEKKWSFLVEEVGNVVTRMLTFGTRLKYHAKSNFSGLKSHTILCRRFFPSSISDLPDPVSNCTAYNATAYTMQFTCVPGNDGGIKQSFFVEVIISEASCSSPHSWGEAKSERKVLFHVTTCVYRLTVILQVFDGKEKVFNVSSEHPTFLLRTLPSDSKLVVRVSLKPTCNFLPPLICFRNELNLLSSWELSHPSVNILYSVFFYSPM